MNKLNLRLKKEWVGPLILLHVLMLFYSLSAVCSKLASDEGVPVNGSVRILNFEISFRFILFYGIVLFILFVYAILWQQVLKKLPLTTAYANKAVTIIWGLVWGAFVFRESITLKQIIASVIIMIGVGLVVTCEDE